MNMPLTETLNAVRLFVDYILPFGFAVVLICAAVVLNAKSKSKGRL